VRGGAIAKSSQSKGNDAGSPAALGFRAHSGWAALVALGGPASAPAILDRRRIELIEGDVPRQPYHASEALDLAEAEKIIKRSVETAARRASEAIREVAAGLHLRGYRIFAGGLLLASGRTLPALPQVLASHALIHTAEGELFREAITTACASYKISLVRVRERELPAVAAGRLAISWEKMQRQLVDLGRPMGPPWGQDQKHAALVAWLALIGN